MTATTVPTAPLPSLDLTKYEGHTPGPWVLDAKNGCISGPGVNGVQVATTFFIGSSNAQKRLEATNARLITDAPQLLAALLTMQRERDEALTKLNSEENAHAELQARCFDNGQPTGGSIFGEIVELRGHLGACKQQLAASERTCAELRETMLTAMGMEKAATLRAEAAERTNNPTKE